MIGKDGPKLEELAKPDEWKSGILPGLPPGRMVFQGNPAAPLETLTGMLSRAAGRPVINRTGLAGFYKIRPEWSYEPDAHDLIAIYAGIVGALPQIGLRLEPRKEKFDVLVIDHVEKDPTPN